MKKIDNYYVFENLDIKHGFFTKPVNYNKQTTTREEHEKILNDVKNLLQVDKLSFVSQEHTDIVKKVTSDNYNDMIPADAMVTNEKNLALGIKIADCQAIYMYDPVKQVIALVHSGWRGTVKKIVGKTIEVMVNDYNCIPKDIKVFIGPSILQDHFEVMEDVYSLFKDSFSNIDKYTIKKGGKYYIDAETLNVDYIKSLGVEEVYPSHICTYCNGDIIHSYRYQRENSGRNLAVISL